MLGLETKDVSLLVAMCLFAWQPWGPLAVLTAVTVFIHVAWGKPRWQLFGAYVCAGLILAGLAVDLVAPQTHRRWRNNERSFDTPLITWGVMRVRTCRGRGDQGADAWGRVGRCGLFSGRCSWLPCGVVCVRVRAAGLYPYVAVPAVLLSLILCSISYAFRLIKPSGPFRVGVIVDRVMRESTFLGGNVDFLLRVYYPVEAAALKEVASAAIPYLKHGKTTARAMANFASLPYFVMDHLRHVEVDVVDFSDTAPAAAVPGAGKHLPSTRLPVVVFSHGLGGVPDIYLSVIQDLASQVCPVVRLGPD